MGEFTAEYLQRTRAGMWEDSRAALSALACDTRDRILDVGCGIGHLSATVQSDCPGTVIGLDADRELLNRAKEQVPVVQGDARSLPFETNTMDLVVCQALLVNLANPVDVVTEFSRVATDMVAAVEPDNSEVQITSTVDDEADLATRARTAYMQGLQTDATLGGDSLGAIFEDAGLESVSMTRYNQVHTVSPPYSAGDLADAREKASGTGLATKRPVLLDGGLSPGEYESLRDRFRSMGRAVIEQMEAGTYRRREVVPFYVVVGEVPS